MSLQRLVKLALLALALALPLLAPTARADDEPSDPRTVILKTYDVRDLGVTNDELTALQNGDGTSWKPNQVSMTGGILVVGGSAAEHAVLDRWISARREGADRHVVDTLLAQLAKRDAELTARLKDLAAAREQCDLSRSLVLLTAKSPESDETQKRLVGLEQRCDALEEAKVRLEGERSELRRAVDALRQPDSEARRKAVAEIMRNLPERGEDGKLYYGELSWLHRWVNGGARPPEPGLELAHAARQHIDRLASQARALERQHADLQRRTSALRDLAGRLEADEVDKRKSLDGELVRIDRTTAELTAKREALIVQRAQLESALAEKQFDRLGEQVAKLEAEAREREASRSARWPRANTSQGPIPDNEILLEEVRALRREVREVKALLRKLLERDGAAVDPRAAR
ncbi:MAG: hypothetical protein R3F05_00010 [Planctomycetota bacterium]